MHPIVTQSSIHYGRIFNENAQVIGNSAYVSIFLKTPMGEPRSGYHHGQIGYTVYRADQPDYDDDDEDSLMCLVFTVYSMMVPLNPSYNDAVKELLGAGQEYYLLSPDYGEGVIAEQLLAGEMTHVEAEELRERNWQERLEHDIAGSVVIRIVEAIEGFTPAV